MGSEQIITLTFNRFAENEDYKRTLRNELFHDQVFRVNRKNGILENRLFPFTPIEFPKYRAAIDASIEKIFYFKQLLERKNLSSEQDTELDELRRLTQNYRPHINLTKLNHHVKLSPEADVAKIFINDMYDNWKYIFNTKDSFYAMADNDTSSTSPRKYTEFGSALASLKPFLQKALFPEFYNYMSWFFSEEKKQHDKKLKSSADSLSSSEHRFADKYPDTHHKTTYVPYTHSLSASPKPVYQDNKNRFFNNLPAKQKHTQGHNVHPQAQNRAFKR